MYRIKKIDKPNGGTIHDSTVKLQALQLEFDALDTRRAELEAKREAVQFTLEQALELSVAYSDTPTQETEKALSQFSEVSLKEDTDD